jgi:hypothetical protein
MGKNKLKDKLTPDSSRAVSPERNTVLASPSPAGRDSSAGLRASIRDRSISDAMKGDVDSVDKGGEGRNADWMEKRAHTFGFVILLLGFLTRMYRLDKPNGVVFDEYQYVHVLAFPHTRVAEDSTLLPAALDALPISIPLALTSLTSTLLWANSHCFF